MLKNFLLSLSHILNLLSTYLLRKADSPQSTTGQIKPTESSGTQCSIVITTFEARFTTCLNMISKIREGEETRPIFVLINADSNNQYHASARSDFLRALSEFQSVFPICLGRKLGMAALWNTGVRLSGSDYIILLNDDLSVHKSTIKTTVDALLEQCESQNLVLLNDSFSHFAISRKCISLIGWFDERFLGFGEEDGDYIFRFEEHFGSRPKTIYSNGLSNHSSEIGYDEILSNVGNKYSLFNTCFLRSKYSFNGGPHQGSFGFPATKIINELNPYPLDDYYYAFLKYLDVDSKAVLDQAFLDYFD
jgi:hypothetical protein